MSTLQVNTLQDTSGNEKFTATAWVTFNGAGTVAIIDSGNVSSITDNATGKYNVNFAVEMANYNYAAAGSAEPDGLSKEIHVSRADSRATTYIPINVGFVASTAIQSFYDSTVVSLIVVGGR